MLLCTTAQTAATHRRALLFLVMFSLREGNTAASVPEEAEAGLRVSLRAVDEKMTVEESLELR